MKLNDPIKFLRPVHNSLKTQGYISKLGDFHKGLKMLIL